MTVPVDSPANYPFTSTGLATQSVPLRILNVHSIFVFKNGVVMNPNDYSVSAIDITIPSFTITFSPVPISGDKFIVFQRYNIEREADYTPGQTLTSAGFNISQDNLVLMMRGLQANFSYIPSLPLADAEAITDGMLALPSLPGTTGLHALTWNGTSQAWELDAASAAQILIDLAKNTSATDSGATKVGFYNGSVGTTVQEGAASIFKLAQNASVSAAGAASIGFYDGATGTTVQEGAASIFKLAQNASVSAAGAASIGFYDGATGTTVQEGAASIFKLKDGGSNASFDGPFTWEGINEPYPVLGIIYDPGVTLTITGWPNLSDQVQVRGNGITQGFNITGGEIPLPISTFFPSAGVYEVVIDNPDAVGVTFKIVITSSAGPSGATSIGFYNGSHGTTVQEGAVSKFILASGDGAKEIGFTRSSGDKVALDKELTLINNRLTALEGGCACADLSGACIEGDVHWTHKQAGNGPIAVSLNTAGDLIVSSYAVAGTAVHVYIDSSGSAIPKTLDSSANFTLAASYFTEQRTYTIQIMYASSQIGVAEFILKIACT